MEKAPRGHKLPRVRRIKGDHAVVKHDAIMTGTATVTAIVIVIEIADQAGEVREEAPSVERLLHREDPPRVLRDHVMQIHSRPPFP